MQPTLKKLLLLLFLIFMSSYALAQDNFSIFLLNKKITDENFIKSGIENLSLQSRPIISKDDIVFYLRDENKIKLTNECYKRIKALPTGIQFVVCVGKKRIYSGIVWSEILSASCNGVIMMKPSSLISRSDDAKRIVSIDLGYPNPSYFVGVDPRSKDEILTSLKKAGKLKE